jgi:imidazoleglycerol-phosphate dehydratase
MRISNIERVTKETSISLSLDIDGGDIAVETGIGFFDHMLHALFFYAGFGASLRVAGDTYIDGHHTVEDTGIVIGKAVAEALGSKTGIRRFASAFVPMDEALCFTALDFSGRAYLAFDAAFEQERIGGYDSCLTEEFMRALSSAAGITLHQRCLYGKNAHHITEALFKSLGLALRDAVKVEGRGVTSTKGVLF